MRHPRAVGFRILPKEPGGIRKAPGYPAFSTTPRDIVKAAFEGRVAHLFFAENSEFQGVWSAELFEIELQDGLQSRRVQQILARVSGRRRV